MTLSGLYSELFFMSAPSSLTSVAKQSPKKPEAGTRRILLLDDDVELVNSLKQLIESHTFLVTAESSSALSAAGFPLKTSRNLAVTTVGSGVEGLNEIMKCDFDVIICDMMMPRMAGDMFYLAVAKTKPHLCDRFLFITGHSADLKINAFLKKTGRQVLIKPVLIDKLAAVISFMLKKTNVST